MNQSTPRMSRGGMLYCLFLLLVLLAVMLFVAWQQGSVLLFMFMAVLGTVALSPVGVAVLTHRAMPDEEE